ncbi:transcriptional regulator [Longispora fulva]|uniref:GntR family transcriptional regulator n=1 Tax=Longispora fulva TaxID=619741 RepID=UPI001A5B78C0|nr:GntR family transcriptional regulator [Longispora fulva]GIG63684.1 transcriptional regulator [Longispora fulva]
MTSLYRKIAAELRDQISRGALRPGDKLPTEPQLVDSYSVSRNTVRLAVALLVNEGLIVIVPGRNGEMVVRDRVTLTYHASRVEQVDGLVAETDAYMTEVQQQGREPTQTFHLTIEALPAELAERLDVADASSAVVRCCLRFVNGEPTSTQDTYYPKWLADEVPELMSPSDIPQGTTRLLAEKGYPQPAYRDELLTRMPTPDEVRRLELPAGTPIMEYHRTGYLPDGRPIRVTRIVFRGDANRVVYTLGDPTVFMNRESAE